MIEHWLSNTFEDDLILKRREEEKFSQLRLFIKN